MLTKKDIEQQVLEIITNTGLSQIELIEALLNVYKKLGNSDINNEHTTALISESNMASIDNLDGGFQIPPTE